MNGDRHGLAAGSDGRPRCGWCVGDPLYEAYHDREWGRPRWQEEALFEKLALEAFQAGLSFRLVLHRREQLRRAFCGFRVAVLAGWGAEREPALLAAAGMIRHPAKIRAVLHNARIAQELGAGRGGFRDFLLGFAPAQPFQKPPQTPAEIPPSRREAKALAAALRRRGWRYIGPVSAYAFMQAMGFVNDHLKGCFVREEVEALRRRAFAEHGQKPQHG